VSLLMEPPFVVGESGEAPRRDKYYRVIAHCLDIIVFGLDPIVTAICPTHFWIWTRLFVSTFGAQNEFQFLQNDLEGRRT
jgi:hypothetical protein